VVTVIVATVGAPNGLVAKNAGITACPLIGKPMFGLSFVQSYITLVVSVQVVLKFIVGTTEPSHATTGVAPTKPTATVGFTLIAAVPELEIEMPEPYFTDTNE